MMLPMLLGGGGKDKVIIPKSVDFDGVNDYLSRSSDFVGNIDSKTFTFSCWVYPNGNTTEYIMDTEANKFIVQIGTSGEFYVVARNASASTALFVSSPDFIVPLNTFSNIIVSVDLTNTASRYVVVNDSVVVPTWNQYNDLLIDFTTGFTTIGALVDLSVTMTGRLAHLFLDYNYRDLSIEANRRIFITPDSKPTPIATLKALNPIVYFPMTDPETCHINEGTGGDMQQNGVIGRSARGPNQWNCVASEFDGVDNSLFLSNAGASDSTTFTIAGVLKRPIGGLSDGIIIGSGSAADYLQCVVDNSFNVKLIARFNSTISLLASVVGLGIENKSIHVAVSCNLSDTNKRSIFINGIDKTVETTWSIYTNTTLPLTGKSAMIGTNANSSFQESVMGELYFDTNYSDLSVDNPFWNSETSRPKPILQVIEETGHTPLIAMPIRADDPEKNYGTGGDFTLNGGPLVGARGGSEFHSRSVVVDGTNYLTGSVYCESLVKWKSLDGGTTWTPTYANAITVTNIGNGTDNGVVSYYWGTSEDINWALEENTLRVTDGLGFPVTMDSVIKDNSNTVLALDFSDTLNFGNNKAGADFTVTGTVLSGADVKGL